MSYDSDAESISSAPVTTSTLLGYVDVEISEDEPIYPNDSFIGGKPIPMDSKSPIPSKYVHCLNCGSPMRLLTQCSAELDDTFYDRNLYVFICIRSECRRKEGTIRAIRGIKKDQDEMKRREDAEKKRLEEEKEAERKKIEKEEEKKNMVQNLFGGSSDDKGTSVNPFSSDISSNPFGGATSSSSSSNPFSTKSNPFDSTKVSEELEKIEKKDEKEKTTFADVAKSGVKESEKKQKEEIEIEYTLPEFKGYILYFEIEKLDPTRQKLAPIPDNLKIEEVDGDGDDLNLPQGNLPKINPEKNKETEDLSKLFDDQTFQNFTRILSFNTQQVVRYEPNGLPILYSSKDKISKIFYTDDGKFKDRNEWNIPNPSYHPGGSRRFEMQLMPKMIIDLENDIDDVKQILQQGMEWGTIIVATDSEDFVPLNWYDDNGVAYVEEWCGVQWEEAQ